MRSMNTSGISDKMRKEFIFEEFAFGDVYQFIYPSFGDMSRGADKLFEINDDNIFSKFKFNPAESLLLHSEQGVLRGMHYQSRDCNRQNRLLYIVSGGVFVAVVDLREHKSTYGCWQGIRIADSDKVCLYVPGDFAIGTLAEVDSLILMFYDKGYEAGYDRGFRYDDDKIGITWGMPENEIHVAEKDLLLPSFQERYK